MRFQTILSILALLFLVAPAIQEIAAEVTIIIDGDFADWEDVPVLIEDDDDIGEDNGDVKEIRVYSTEDTFYAMLTVYGTTVPKDGQRYYYHFLIDADNDHNTGWDNSEYEGIPTGVENPIGADFYVQVGLQDSAANGIEVYFLTAAGGDDSGGGESFQALTTVLRGGVGGTVAGLGVVDASAEPISVGGDDTDGNAAG